MIDHRPEERRLNFDAVFFRAVIDHQCARLRRARTDATEVTGIDDRVF